MPAAVEAWSFNHWITSSVSSVQSLSHVQLFATPCITARQASLSITNSRSSLRLMSMESVMPSSHLSFCHPLLLLPPIPPSIRVFSNEYEWISALKWRSTLSPSLLPHPPHEDEVSRQAKFANQKKVSSQRYPICWCLDLRLPTSRTVRNKCLLLKPLIYGNLLQQPKLTVTVSLRLQIQQELTQKYANCNVRKIIFSDF